MIADADIRTADPEKLIKQFMPLIFKLANRYIPLLERTPAIDKEDLYQAGTIALIKAQKAYTPDQGCSFLSFVYKPIKWHMLRTIGVNNGKLPPLMESLDMPLFDDEPDGDTLADATADPTSPDGYTEAEKESDREKVREAVAGLKSEKHRAIIGKVYFEDKDRQTAADELHMKRGALYAAENEALKKLRRNCVLQTIAGCKPNHITLAHFRYTFSSEQETALLRAEKLFDEKYGDGAYMAMKDVLLF